MSVQSFDKLSEVLGKLQLACCDVVGEFVQERRFWLWAAGFAGKQNRI
ncbi:MAG: hypothetical protein ANABAC_2011 [Anaerolineae bacterium]|jgi:hypothetical protein|nr:MAG: hypothetical protein ANABAC_2011 [Anaerolineae bacterium]